jgi:aminoacyl-tRNA hydrolase
MINGEKVILMKPQTYMNDSGKAVIQAMNFYKLPIENLIVIYDDIDISEGVVKIRKKGGPGTHNGMRSLMEYLNNVNFLRVRIGTGKPIVKELLIQHVIEKLSDDKYAIYVPAIEKAGNATIDIIVKGVDLAMNLNNGSE